MTTIEEIKDRVKRAKENLPLLNCVKCGLPITFNEVKYTIATILYPLSEEEKAKVLKVVQNQSKKATIIGEDYIIRFFEFCSQEHKNWQINLMKSLSLQYAELEE
jgi:hypothetical protein